MAFQNTCSVTREDCRMILLNDSVEFQGKLLCARVFFRGPLTDAIETVAIYSTEGHEVRTWIDNKIKFYKEHNIPFAAYLNYWFEDADGDLFKDGEAN